MSTLLTTPNPWHERLHKAIPWGASTISKAPLYLPEEPAVIVRGQGCRVWDDQGREFIDYRLGLGPVTLGHCYPAVDEAVRQQLTDGIVFGHCHPLEAQVAEMLCEIIPCAEQVRFLKTGGEAIAACIRAARTYTGREQVIQVGYNGWLNALSTGGKVLPGVTTQHAPPGVPISLSRIHHACPWNDVSALERVLEEQPGNVAAIVVAADYATMHHGSSYYPAVRALADKHGAVLIFDEIVTGFRIALAGVQDYFKVVPDMAVYAKGIANGMPLAAYAGRRDLMQAFKKAPVSSTYGGETLSLAAAKATIETYQRENVVGHLWQQGQKLWTAVNQTMQAFHLPIVLQGAWPCPCWTYHVATPAASGDLSRRFMRSAFRHGLCLYNVSYVSFSHGDQEMQETLARFERVCEDLGHTDDQSGDDV